MNKVLTILLFSTLLSNAAKAQINTFTHIYGGSGNDKANAIIETYDNGFAILGSTSSISNGTSDMLLLRVDSAGELMWSKVFGGSNIDLGYDLKQTPDSGLILLGYSNSYSQSYDILILKVDKEGKTIWQKNYGGDDWDFAYAIDTTENNGYVVVGETYSYGNGGSDVFVLNLNSNGDTIWTKSYGTELNEVGNDIITTYQGDFILVGSVEKSDSNKNFIIKHIKQSNGDTIWTLEYGNQYINQLNKLVNCYDSSSFAVIGTKYLNGIDSSRMYISKIDTSGIILWEKYFGDSKLNLGNSIYERRGGSFIITGQQNNDNQEAVSFVTSPLGAWWSKTKIDEYRNDEFFDIVQPDNNGVIMVGNSNSFDLGYSDIILMKTDNQLNQDSIYFSYTTLDLFNTTINSIKNNNQLHGLICYPNPSENKVTLELPNNKNIELINIYNVLGSKILSTRNAVLSNKINISLLNLNNGLYLIEIQEFNSKKTHYTKIEVKK